MVASQDLYLSVGYAMTTAGSLTSLALIRGYLRKKSPGMQTIFDRAVQDLTIATSMVVGYFTFLIVAPIFIGPFPKALVMPMIYLLYYLITANCLGFLVVIVIRYLSIHHGSIIEEVDEDTVVKYCRICVNMFSFSSVMFEGILLSEGKGEIFAIMSGDREEGNNSSFGKILVFIMVSDLLILLVTQLRIELDNFKEKQLTQELPYNLVSLRCMLIMILVSSGIVLIYLLPHTFFKVWYHVGIREYGLLSQFIGYTVFPIMLIARNPKLQSYALIALRIKSC